MLTIGTRSQVTDYFNKEAVSSSLLKRVLKGRSTPINIDDKEHVIIGSAVDNILLMPEGDFEESFVVINEPKATGTVKEIIQRVYNDVLEWNTEGESVKELDWYKDFIVRAAREAGYQNNYKDETLFKTLVKSGKTYFEYLKRGSGKTIVSTEEKQKIDRIVDALKKDSSTKAYFDRDAIRDNNYIHVFYQVPLYFEYKGFDCKALPDLVIFIYENQETPSEIIILDLKTTASVASFKYQCKRLRYDIQSSWYTLAVNTLWPEVQTSFRFIVAQVDERPNPTVFEPTEVFMKVGKNGFPAVTGKVNIKSGGETVETIRRVVKGAVKGYDDLLEDYKELVNNDWQKPLPVNENGFVELGWYDELP